MQDWAHSPKVGTSSREGAAWEGIVAAPGFFWPGMIKRLSALSRQERCAMVRSPHPELVNSGSASLSFLLFRGWGRCCLANFLCFIVGELCREAKLQGGERKAVLGTEQARGPPRREAALPRASRCDKPLREPGRGGAAAEGEAPGHEVALGPLRRSRAPGRC